MENQRKYPIKIQLKLGVVKKNINNPMPAKGICKNCGKLIYWIRIIGRKWKVQATHLKDNEFVHHALVCPKVLAFNEKIKRIKLSRKY